MSKFKATETLIPHPTRILLRVFLVSLVLFSGSAVGDQQGLSSFDHLTETGFELTAVHRLTACESCHLFGVFEGTPRNCRGCHGAQGRRTASRKGARHILSSDNCELCHQSSVANSWVPVRRVDHLEVRGSCFSCHNNFIASGRPVNHIPSSNRCEDCHNARSWLPARFTHEGIFTGCARCHNGNLATGKGPNHILTTNVCEACHTNTRTWEPVARADHSEMPQALAGQCIACHFLNSPYGGKIAGHVRGGVDSTNNCASCHGTTGNWPVRRMDHSELQGNAGDPATSTKCQNCHSQLVPPLLPKGHPAGPTATCSNCHRSTNDWCITIFPTVAFPQLCN